jgi:hypothetical protein
MNLRPPERFVDVDVPEPRDRSLIEEGRLDRCAPAFEPLRQPACRKGAPERLGAESRFEVRLELTGFE